MEAQVVEMVVDEYLSGAETKELAERYKVDRKTIYNNLVKAGINMRLSRVSKGVRDKVVELYMRGYTNKELSSKFSIHRTTIQRILKAREVELRDSSCTSRKHFLKNFDGVIRNEYDAYILGLLYADGSIHGNVVEISLQEKDVGILEKVSEYVYGEVVLGKRLGKTTTIKGKMTKSKPQRRFSISSKKVANRVYELGMSTNKTHYCVMPDIDKNLVRHFIRGFIDGDGCIFVSKKYPGTHRVTITSNEPMLLSLKAVIEAQAGVSPKINDKTHVVKTLNISGNKQMGKFLEWIYADSKIHLDRKYNKYKEFLTLSDLS